jgi:hypothetical protein
LPPTVRDEFDIGFRTHLFGRRFAWKVSQLRDIAG